MSKRKLRISRLLDGGLNVLVLLAVGMIVYRLFLPRPSDSLGDLTHQPLLPPGHVTLVELGASYCSACWMMKPIVYALQKSYGDRIRVEVLDIDHSDGEAQRLAAAVHLRATPTLLVTDAHGIPRAKFVGTTSYAALASALNSSLKLSNL